MVNKFIKIRIEIVSCQLALMFSLESSHSDPGRREKINLNSYFQRPS